LDIIGITDAPKRWTSVQFGRHRHIELNSELVYINHSCDPTVIFDVKNNKLVAAKDINVGDEFTFFYPR
jgi:SET domain-containing protein